MNARYERRSKKKIQPGDVLKDPRSGGHRVVMRVSDHGYNLWPHYDMPYSFLLPWPKVGRMKVLKVPHDTC